MIKKINCELEKNIIVIDDAFDHLFRSNIFNLARNLSYSIGWDDNNIAERKKYDQHLYCSISKEIVDNHNIIQKFQAITEVNEAIKDLHVCNVVMNLSVPTNVNYVHSHSEKKVLLYYVNLYWPEGGHGETQYWSENLKDIQYTCPYTPGRLIIFDGSIPHTIRPQSIVGPKFRYTLTVLYN